MATRFNSFMWVRPKGILFSLIFLFGILFVTTLNPVFIHNNLFGVFIVLIFAILIWYFVVPNAKNLIRTLR